MKTLILLISLFTMINTFGDPTKDHKWIDADSPLLGDWTSEEVKGFGDGDIVMKFTLKLDGTMESTIIRSELEKNGKLKVAEEKSIGLFAVGADHLYFWSDGPPKGFKTDRPQDHRQSMLVSYKLEDGNLVLQMVSGGPRGGVIKLKKK